jgi:hypothetical protein
MRRNNLAPENSDRDKIDAQAINASHLIQPS